MQVSAILTQKSLRFALRLGWALVLVLTLLWLVHPTQAATSGPIVVDIFDDIKKNDGACSLREAIIAANSDKRTGGCAAGRGADTILLPPGRYILSRTDNGGEDAAQTGDLDIDGDLEIVVVDGYGATIDASGITDRALHILAGNVSVSNVAIVGGGPNVEDGGGIYNEASLTLTNVTVSGNSAQASGGGIYNRGTLTLNHVTVSGNSADGAGGGIYNEAGGEVGLANTIVAAQDSGTDCAVPAAVTSNGHNLDSDDSCNLTASGDIPNADPLLGPLQDNGGGTLTHALLIGSPAIDAGDLANCPPTDQRGVERPQGLRCDIGAFEALNEAPLAKDDSYSTDEDTPLVIDDPDLGVLFNDSDPEGDALTAILVSNVSHGTLDLNGDGSFAYTPDADFNGTDTFTYQASDGFKSSNIATVTITVNSVNDAPTAVDDAYSVDEDAVLSVDAPGVLSNDGDPDGDAFAAILVNDVSHGTLIFNTDGSFIYTPDLNFNGEDSFTYKASDGTLDSDVATVTITINPVNDSPTAVDDAYSVDEDSILSVGAPGVLGNDSDVDVGDVLAAILVDNVSHGTLDLNADGSFTYTPAPNFDGTDSFTYQASDGALDSNGATVTITVIPDGLIEVTNTYDDGPGSLRWAIEEANTNPVPDTIIFEIPGPGPYVIQLLSALPTVTDRVIIDGTTQVDGPVVIDGSLAGEMVSGLTITSGDSTVSGLEIVHFDGNGILLEEGDNNLIEGNPIAYNGGDGIRILDDSTGNTITGNDIHDNGGLGIDLGGDGPTPNDLGDPDTGANYVQNYPVLFRAFPDGGNLMVHGWLNSQPGTEFNLEFFATETCIPGQMGNQTWLGWGSVETDDDGNQYFQIPVEEVAMGDFVVATATDPDGNTSEFSACVSVSPGNDSWPWALRLYPGASPAVAEHYVDMPGLSRWYKFSIEPNSEVIVTLTGLPANYDLMIFKDIAAAFLALQAPEDPLQDLLHLGAEFAPGSFSPGSFSPGSFSPDIYAPGSFSPGSFSPGSFSPGSFSPDIFAPGSFSPGSFSPGSFSPGSFSPGSFSPGSFSPGSFSPGSFSPGSFSPGSFSPGSFSSAQTRSLIGFSAFDGTAGEGIYLNTWNNTGDFYVRVSGRLDAHNQETPFYLQVWHLEGGCGDVSDALPGTTLAVSPGDRETIVLIDRSRMETTADLETALSSFVERLEVKGVVVDVSEDEHVLAANAQADLNYACPYAKNVVADEIKDIIDEYRATNPIKYIVIVGNDFAIPFRRYPDRALLGHESNYVPPVRDATASQASLRLGYVLGQDAYGAQTDVSVNASVVPIPDLPVGRLVETPAEIVEVLNAYLSTDAGIVPTPASAFVSGYDFLEDAALAVQSELEAGLGPVVDTLIAPYGLAPLDPAAWTADDLGALFLNNRYDMAYLAGHFSANSALAADFTTNLLTTDLVASTVDMANAIIYSAGCHSGYNIANEDDIEGITFQPDWAQAFAQKGATLIAGTGYQYGDTDFIEYSERLYLEFTRQLRTGSGPVSIGNALVAAKQDYLATTPVLRGIHEKALLEATIFGLPMLSVNMPGARITPQTDDPIVEPPLDDFGTDPGAALDLQFADVTLDLSLDLRAKDLDVVDEQGQVIGQVTANWLDGSDGVISNPTEPVLPLELEDVTVPGTVLRGIGFRGGDFTDIPNVLALTGAPNTEIRGVHTPFYSPVFYPIRFWHVNYFDALADADDGITQLVVTPAQFQSGLFDPQRGTLRGFDSLDLRLYYSSDTQTYGGDSTPALAAAPTIVGVSAVPDGNSVSFRVNVVGNPAAGIQEVWVTHADISNPGTWEPLDLTQSSEDSTLWEGILTLPPGVDPCDIRYMVQAVNGVGLVTLETNQGAYFSPCAAAPTQPTALDLAILSPESHMAPYGSQTSFTARLTSNGIGLDNQLIVFGLGSQIRLMTTDGDGWATVRMPVLGLPASDPYEVRASYFGTYAYEPSFATDELTIEKAETELVLEPEYAVASPSAKELLVATLRDEFGHPLNERKTVFFVATDSAGDDHVFPVVTDLAGRAVLGRVDLPSGSYDVIAYFNGQIPGVGTLEDERYKPATSNTATLELSACLGAYADPLTIWPQDKEFYPVEVRGVIDPAGVPYTIRIDSIFQDEPVGKNKFSPDGIIDDDIAWVRAERAGKGDGRVYHIFFTALDGDVEICEGEVVLGIVPHDQARFLAIIDGGALYDSTIPE